MVCFFFCLISVLPKNQKCYTQTYKGLPEWLHSLTITLSFPIREVEVKLRTETLTSLPGLRGSSNHAAHLLGSFLLGLVSLQHSNGLLHLGETSFLVRPVLLPTASRSPAHLKEQASSPLTGGTPETLACAGAPSCQSLAAFL